MTNTQDKLTQTHRHGYAVFTEDDILIGWTLTLELARQFPHVHQIRNVQNDAIIIP